MIASARHSPLALHTEALHPPVPRSRASTSSDTSTLRSLAGQLLGDPCVHAETSRPEHGHVPHRPQVADATGGLDPGTAAELLADDTDVLDCGGDTTPAG